jgi:hypothetical protein
LIGRNVAAGRIFAQGHEHDIVEIPRQLPPDTRAIRPLLVNSRTRARNLRQADEPLQLDLVMRRRAMHRIAGQQLIKHLAQ